MLLALGLCPMNDVARPAPWFGARCRGRVAGDLVGGLAGPGWLCRASLDSDLAVPGRDQPLHERAAIEPLWPSTERPLLDPYLPEPTRLGDVLWLEPYPDVLLEGLADNAAGPEAHYLARGAISLAFVTALQLLPPPSTSCPDSA